MNGKAEADAGAAQTLGLNFGRGVDVDAESFEHFGRAATGAGAVAVLGHEDAGLIGGAGAGGDDDRGDGRNVEHLGGAAGTTGIDEHLAILRFDGHARDMPAHRGCGADEFVGNRPTDLDQRQQGPDLGVIQPTGEEALKEHLGLGGREGFPGEKLRQCCVRFHVAERTPIGEGAPIE